MSDLRELIDDGAVHVLDGAMGTLLYERGVFVNVCYDELTLSEAPMVESIHREYVQAGAEVLETNTFGANPLKLSGWGLEERTEEINRAAAELARKAAEGQARVVGAVGPLGVRIEPWGPTSEQDARAYFARQVRGLIEGGVDGFLLETFSDLNELRQALEAVREASELPVFAHVTIEEGGRTSYGATVETAARVLDEWGADVIGLNCSVGPVEILDAVERMAEVTDRPLSAQPNAGLPRTVGDRKIYLASPEYMARYARRMTEVGVRFVGGCCGTTPEHTRALRAVVDEVNGATPAAAPPPGGAIRVRGKEPPSEPGDREPFRSSLPAPSKGAEAVPLEERSPLGRALTEGRFVTSLELLPPRGWDPAPLLETAREAAEAEVDVVSVVDSSRGRRRMSSIAAGSVVEREAGVGALVHYTCRDRNMLRMISDLLGAAALGARNLLVVSGDPVPTGPYPDHTTVFDIDAIGLVNVLRHLNLGLDPGGHAVDPPTRFVVGVAANPGAADLERERRRFRWKVEAGADFAVTQPIFDPRSLGEFLDAVDGHRIPVLAGLWALSSRRDAEYLAQEVPGVRVPQEILRRMEEAEAQGPDRAREEGLRILDEVMEEVLPRVQGIHVTSPRGDLKLAIRVAGEARRRARELAGAV